MYKKSSFLLCLFMLFMGMCTVQAKGMDPGKTVPEDVLQQAFFFHDGTEETSSTNRTAEYHVLVNENAVCLDEESYEILCRIVEAEAGNEDEAGRMLVANVVLNRVESSRFPDTVKEVVFQKKGGYCQFSPIATGGYYRVKVSEQTREAVEKVLRGADASQGALYFVNRYAANPDSMSWFDSKCTFLFAHGHHEFFS